MAHGRSLIYKINNKGPKMEPCGTPLMRGLLVDLKPSQTTFCVLQVVTEPVKQESMNAKRTKFMNQIVMRNTVKCLGQIQEKRITL